MVINPPSRGFSRTMVSTDHKPGGEFQGLADSRSACQLPHSCPVSATSILKPFGWRSTNNVLVIDPTAQELGFNLLSIHKSVCEL